MILKEAYHKKIPAKIKEIKLHYGVLEEYDLNLIKLSNRSAIKLKMPTIQQYFIEKDIFE